MKTEQYENGKQWTTEHYKENQSPKFVDESPLVNGTLTTINGVIDFTAGRRHRQWRRVQVYWLSGLTCTDENFSQKAGAFQAACDNQVQSTGLHQFHGNPLVNIQKTMEHHHF